MCRDARDEEVKVTNRVVQDTFIPALKKIKTSIIIISKIGYRA